MPRIKLIRVHTSKYGYYSTAAKKAGESITDWEDVTHEELRFLKSTAGRQALINQKEGFEDYIIVEKLEKAAASSRLQDLKDLMNKAKKADEERRADLRRKQEEKQLAEKKKAEQEERRKIDEAKKLLEKKGIKVFE